MKGIPVLQLLVLLAVLAGCSAGAAREGDRVEQLTVTHNLAAHGGRTVAVYGRMSQVPHQHLLAPEAAKGHKVDYFQLDEAYQIVAYFPLAFSGCEGPLRLAGEVLKVEGGSKRPPGQGQEQKRDRDPGYVEHQLKVASWDCLVEDSPAGWLRELGLKTVPAARKQQLLKQLAAQGKAAIPLLIAHLRDERPFGTRQQVPAAAINAPAHAPAPQPVTVTLPVGPVCSDLLYELITPAYSSPHMRTGKPFSQSYFLIRDWPHWWQANRHKSLEQIRKELEPRIDRYWLEHGTVQVID